MDVKILSKILASRIEHIIPGIISQDKASFIKGHHSFINIRKLLNVVRSPSESNPEVIISLDAEKAFTRVEWKYLFAEFDKFVFSSNLTSWICLIQQDGPLNPLFILSIKPLSVILRTLHFINGIKRIGVEYKVSLYADDLLLYY